MADQLPVEQGESDPPPDYFCISPPPPYSSSNNTPVASPPGTEEPVQQTGHHVPSLDVQPVQRPQRRVPSPDFRPVQQIRQHVPSLDVQPIQRPQRRVPSPDFRPVQQIRQHVPSLDVQPVQRRDRRDSYSDLQLLQQPRHHSPSLFTRPLQQQDRDVPIVDPYHTPSLDARPIGRALQHSQASDPCTIDQRHHDAPSLDAQPVPKPNSLVLGVSKNGFLSGSLTVTNLGNNSAAYDVRLHPSWSQPEVVVRSCASPDNPVVGSVSFISFTRDIKLVMHGQECRLEATKTFRPDFRFISPTLASMSRNSTEDGRQAALTWKWHGISGQDQNCEDETGQVIAKWSTNRYPRGDRWTLEIQTGALRDAWKLMKHSSEIDRLVEEIVTTGYALVEARRRRR